MKLSRNLPVFCGVVGFLLVGCGSSEAPTITKDQEASIRHPVANPNYKGPDPAAYAKMDAAMKAFQDKHANDKVEFNK